jgi:divalent metal cation (Fe/Co/Zn/Cd) transporter
MHGMDRTALVARSRRLTTATLLYNSVEGLLASGAGLLAGSIALVGFGVDSLIELLAGLLALWRLAADAEPARRARVERRSLRLVGGCFLALAGFVLYDSTHSLLVHHRPEESLVGMGLAAASLVVMPWLAHRKRALGLQLESGTLVAEATQTLICTYLSAILLGGLLLNAVAGWWWADPAAALAMVPFIVREGILGVRGQSSCCPTCAATPAGLAN